MSIYTPGGIIVPAKAGRGGIILPGVGGAEAGDIGPLNPSDPDYLKLHFCCLGTAGALYTSTTSKWVDFGGPRHHPYTSSAMAIVDTVPSPAYSRVIQFNSGGLTLASQTSSGLFVFGTGDYEIGGYVRRSNMTGTKIIFDKVSSYANGSIGFRAEIRADGAIEYLEGPNTTAWLGSAAGVIAVNTWYRVQFMRKAGVRQIRVNDNIVATTTSSNNIPGNGTLTMGRAFDNNLAWIGEMSDMYIYTGVAKYWDTPPPVRFDSRTYYAAA